MFRKLPLYLILLVLPLTTLMFCFNAQKSDEDKMSTIMITASQVLEYLHYSPKPINEAYSREVFSEYISALDPMKRYFTQEDISEFKKHEDKLGTYLKTGDLTFFRLTNKRLLERMSQVDKISKEILDAKIDFTANEQIILDEKKRNFAASEEEYKKEWKKFIKLSILQEIETLNGKEERRKEKKDSVQKNGLKDTIQLKILSPEEKLKKSTQEVRDLMSDVYRRVKQRKEIDWFTIYMNAYTTVYDPHTNYLSPKNKEDFDMIFSGTVTGIGAIIQEKKGYLYLGPLTIGAPAWKSKQLDEGDKILKVKPSPEKETVNVVGLINDEAVRLIRGPKGTKVTLTVEKKDGTVKDVTMIREEIEIEDTFARSMIIESENGKKSGYIMLPSFNTSMDGKTKRNASDDIKNEILKLKKQNISGIILDLRNNGGGSLTEVGDIMGLFMKTGPYVQVRERNGKVTTLKNSSDDVIWDGPLVVMQNELSASASEILAGAIKDYGRGLVFGSPQSFGKGTVQTFVDLNRFIGTEEDFGSLKLTIQKFYRVTGESTQRKGVDSDIKLKDFFSYAEIGERFEKHALPWDQIAPTNYTKVGKIDFRPLEAATAERMRTNRMYQLMQESAQWKEELDKEKSLPLEWNAFFAVMKQRKAKIDSFKPLDRYNNHLKFILHPDEFERRKKDEAFSKKTENWLKSLQKDFYLQDAVLNLEKLK